MNLEEAIKHCEEVAEAEERSAKLHQRPDKGVKGSGKRYLSCIECAKEHRQLADWLRELKAYKENPMYLWFPINKKLPNQYQHVIAILRSGAEVETYLAHEMWHIVDGVRVNFGDVVFWRHKEVNTDEDSD